MTAIERIMREYRAGFYGEPDTSTAQLRARIAIGVLPDTDSKSRIK